MSDEAAPFWRMLVFGEAGQLISVSSAGRSIEAAAAWTAAAARYAARRGKNERYVLEGPDGARRALTMAEAVALDTRLHALVEVE